MERRKLPLPICPTLATLARLVAIACLACILFSCTQASRASRPASYVPGQLLVVPASPGDDSTIRALAGVQVLNQVPQLGLMVVGVPEGEEQSYLDKLRRDPAVEVVELNSIASSTSLPISFERADLVRQAGDSAVHGLTVADDPAFMEGRQWNLPRIQAPPGWDTTTGSQVRIAMLGTGVDPHHPDLQGKLDDGWDFVNKDEEPLDDDGMGTFEAGIAAAITSNEVGMAGTSWGARIIPVKVLRPGATGVYSDIIMGIVWAADHGANVICAPLGGTEKSVLLQRATDYALTKNILTIASAGDEGGENNPAIYPAANAQVLGVTASNELDAKLPTAGYSTSIDFVDLTAPGANILSTWSHAGTHEYGVATGTNLAAPQVAGVAALMLSVNPTLTPAVLESILEYSATDLGTRNYDKYFGWGMVNAQKAVEATPHFLQVSPDYLVFTDDGQDIIPAVARVVNKTTSCTTWTAEVTGDAVNWLEISDPSGGTPSDITVTARRAPSDVCVRTGAIVVRSKMAEAVNSPQIVDVVLHTPRACHKYYVPFMGLGKKEVQ